MEHHEIMKNEEHDEHGETEEHDDDWQGWTW